MNSKPILKFYRINQLVPLPTFATKKVACFDLAFCAAGKQFITKYTRFDIEERIHILSHPIITLDQHERVLIPTGLIFDIPRGWSLRLHPRSGLSIKRGLTLVNCEGVVDSDYRYECFVPIINVSDTMVGIREFDRIAQAELIPILDYTLEETKELPQQTTDRDGGFGSTGS